jgi:putative acetyltransferase
VTLPILRPFRTGDEATLLAVFRSSVHGLACRDYNAEQIAAWAPDSLDAADWAQRMQQRQPWVMELNGSLLAYADLQADGHIDHFFVAAPSARQGVGTLLMTRLHESAHQRGITRLWADVSRTAQPFFSQFGFVITEQRCPVVRGVAVPNARMEKCLPAARPLSRQPCSSGT